MTLGAIGASVLLGLKMMTDETRYMELECSGVMGDYCSILRTMVLYKGCYGFVFLTCLYMVYTISVNYKKVNFNFKVLPVLIKPISNLPCLTPRNQHCHHRASHI